MANLPEGVRPAEERRRKRLNPAEKMWAREKIMKEGFSATQVAQLLGCDPRTIQRAVEGLGADNSNIPTVKINGKRTDDTIEAQIDWIAENPPPKTRVWELYPEWAQRKYHADELTEEEMILLAHWVPEINALWDLNVWCELFEYRRLKPHQQRWVNFFQQHDFAMLLAPVRHGKALALDTPIATPDGWKNLGDLVPGDKVFDDLGQPTTVLATSETFHDRPCYRVLTDDGDEIVADAAHEWPVKLDARWGENIHETQRLAKKRRGPVISRLPLSLETPEKELPIDPYVLGVWLGDGSSGSGVITAVGEDAKFIRYEIESRGYKTSDQATHSTFGVLGIIKPLRLMGLRNNKHIPAEYLWASKSQRLDLLRGLIDTDGYVAKDGQVEFCSTRLDLAKGVQQLVRSLGHKASLNTGRATLNGKDCGAKYRVTFYMDGAAALPRKADRCRSQGARFRRYLSAEPCESVPVRCIQVDSPSSLFLAGRSMTPTHNSELLSVSAPCWWSCGGGFEKEYYYNPEAQLRNTQVMLVAKSEGQIKKNFLAIEARLLQSKKLIQAYGRFKGHDLPWKQSDGLMVIDGRNRLEESGDYSIKIVGAGSASLGSGADRIVVDDAFDLKNTRSAEQIEERLLWLRTEVFTRLEDIGSVWVIGARLPIPNDPYGALEDLTVAEFAEDELDDEEQETEKVFTTLVEPAIQDWETKQVLWPEKWSFKNLMVRRGLVGSRVFDAAWQQNRSADGLGAIKREWIYGHGDHIGCLDKERPLGLAATRHTWEGKPVPFTRVMTFDPSPEKYSAGFIMDIPRLPNQIFAPWLIDISRQRRMSGQQMLDLAYRWHAEYDYKVLIFEAVAAERLMLSTEQWRDFQRRTGVRLVQQKTHAYNKAHETYGKHTLATDVEFGRIRIPWGDLKARTEMNILIKELLEEVSTDDCWMSLWFAKVKLEGINATNIDTSVLSRGFNRRHIAAPPRLTQALKPVGSGTNLFSTAP